MIVGRGFAWPLVVVTSLACAAIAMGCRRAPRPVDPATAMPVVAPWDEGPVLEGAMLEIERGLVSETEALLVEAEQDPGWLGGPELEAYLASVLDRLRPEAADGETEFRVRVIRQGTLNGRAWPGRVVVLDAGLLAVLESEAELAFILGHELVHLLEHHAALDAQYRERTASHVKRMKFSRLLEDRADAATFAMMQAAGYPPSIGSLALRRLKLGKPATGRRIRAWESHPDIDDRIRAAREKWGVPPELEADQGTFGATIDSVRLDAAELLLDEGETPVARGVVDRHLVRNPEDAPGFYLRSRITRKGDRSEAAKTEQIRDLERAVEIDPEEADSLRTLGLLLARGESPDRGVELLERYLRVRPEAEDRPLVEREIGRYETPPRAP